MSKDMYDELCDKCHKSLFLIHPDDQFNCNCPDESHTFPEDGPVFIFQEDEEAKHSTAQIKELEIGDSFIFMGQRFTKRNDMGWGLGVCNVVDSKGQIGHLHPTTRIQLIH